MLLLKYVVKSWLKFCLILKSISGKYKRQAFKKYNKIYKIYVKIG